MNMKKSTTPESIKPSPILKTKNNIFNSLFSYKIKDFKEETPSTLTDPLS